MSDAVQAELRQALFDFEVIFFRPQVITPSQHITLGKVFGPLSSGSYFDRRPDAPELEVITSDEARPPAIDNWHTAISWKPNPPLGTAIQIIVTPWAVAGLASSLARSRREMRAPARSATPDPARDIAYLCGNPEMVDACFGLLKDAGLPVPAIRREKYVSPPDPKGRSAGLAVVSE